MTFYNYCNEILMKDINFWTWTVILLFLVVNLIKYRTWKKRQDAKP